MKNKLLFLSLTMILILGVSLSSNAYASDEPLFVTITTEWCSTCKQLKPVIEQLEDDYSGQINFLTLNPSTKASLEESREKVSEYGEGVSDFFEKNKNTVPIVGILCPNGTKVEKTFIGETNIEAYEKALDELLADTNTICSL